MLAPGELGAAEEATEEPRVERVEDFIQVVIAALGTGEALAAASVADKLGLADHGGAGGETLVTQVMRGVDGLFIELGEQDVGDGADYRLRRAFEKVGKADVDLAFAQADGGVERRKAAEAHRYGRHGSAGA